MLKLVIQCRAVIALMVLVFLSLSAGANTAPHGLMRRIAVFPIKTEKVYQDVAEEAWWSLREYLTGNQRFLLASKHFLVRKDVFQPRTELSPADSIILGKLLDANALVTIYLNDRELKMNVYDGEFGRTIWQKQVTLHGGLPIKDQLQSAVLSLGQSFVASIPYQGFLVVDPLIGKPTYQEGQHVNAKVNIGVNSKIEAGDGLQFVQIFTRNLEPMFDNGANMVVVAEGRVLKIEGDLATVEILRARDLKDLQEMSLARFPKEAKRLQDLLSPEDSLVRKIGPEVFQPELKAMTKEKEEKKPLVAAISFIANIAAFLLIAF